PRLRTSSPVAGSGITPQTPPRACRHLRKKKPAWRNARGHSTTPAYSLTDSPAAPGCPSQSLPTSSILFVFIFTGQSIGVLALISPHHSAGRRLPCRKAPARVRMKASSEQPPARGRCHVLLSGI